MWIAVYNFDGQPELGFPKGFPKNCHQYATEEEARKAHPEADVMTEEDYNKMHAALLAAHEGKLPLRPTPKVLNWFERKVLRKRHQLPFSD